MSDRASLVAAIAASRDDDLPTLVFADWLEENGDPERAEFIRLSVAYHREASAFPPTPDPAKPVRIGELFITRYRDWLGPVYGALAQPMPTFEVTQSRPVRLGFRESLDETWRVTPHGDVVLTHARERAAISLTLRAGLVSLLVLNAGRLPPTASFTQAMSVEPLGVLNVSFPADVGVWQRFDGPHLARVRSLIPNFWGAGDFQPTAEALCEGEHLRGLTDMTIGPEMADRTSPTSILFDALRSSPLRRQLTNLTLYDLPGAAHLLSRPDHGFDSLRELRISTRARRATTSHLFASGVSDWLRERLTQLAIGTSLTHGVGWLTGGKPWERLEMLILGGDGVGDIGAVALAGTKALPALRQLRLNTANVTDTGAMALARSPLVHRLNALSLDGNPVGDDGARELASALDHGLGYLAVRPPHAISDRTQHELATRYGPRVTFTYPLAG